MDCGATWPQLVAGTSAADAAMAPLKLCTVRDAGLLIRNVMRIFPDSGMALQWGQRFGLNARGNLGLAMMSMQTFADVAQHGERVRELFDASYQLHHEVRGDEVWLMISYPGQNPLAPGACFHAEAMFASYVTVIQTLLGIDGRALRVHMPGAAPVYVTQYQQYLAHETVFDGSSYAMVYPASLMSMPIKSASRTLAARYLEDFNVALREASQLKSLCRRVMQSLDARAGAYPDLATMAAQLGMSERSMRRKLALEGRTFQQLLNQVKAKHAQQKLQDQRLSVDAVAAQLGFSDVANFRKAFRKWTDMSPAQWREKLEHDQWQPR